MKKSQRRQGFTLIEVLIVVVILGILAATVLPQFTSANSDAKQSALGQDLQTLRSQIQLYKFQHGGQFPGGPTATAVTFANALTLPTDVNGNTAAPGTAPGTAPYIYGPYFSTLPSNPYNGAAGVAIVAAPISGATVNSSSSIGWLYSPTEGLIKGNTTGNDSNGNPLINM